jgi:hypothetical protein
VAQPSCSQCLHDTMQIFAQYAVDSDQPLARTYEACASQIDGVCGAGFVDTSVKVGSVVKNSAGRGKVSRSGLFTGFMTVFTVLMALL